MSYELKGDVRSEMDAAVALMTEALAILDRHGQIMAAISLSTAIEQAGGLPPEPAGQDRVFGCYG
ncbi:hypothetical protein PQ455_14195 [Sphingomonas naphthae]|uniref:Uncharacterized protein n=1 Tax=Sphingomonas naphthae TaxID=1813468 RepID=A0ABY7TKH0_9SPHN|nr:hypothetical protein [Sphingomonas naphthae]WCT72779.1 hypothetical protein PQ455_14195 [Sphingomonas naphthae]